MVVRVREWGWCDDDEDRRDRGGARETIWDYLDSWLTTTGLTTHLTTQHTTPHHTNTSSTSHLKLCVYCQPIFHMFGFLELYQSISALVIFYSVPVLFRIYIFMMWWCEVAQLQNHMMKKRLTVIHFVLCHLFLFTMQWKVFFIRITSLHYMYISAKQNISFWVLHIKLYV